MKDNNLFIDDLDNVIKIVTKENEERQFNSGIIQDADSGVAIIDGEPHSLVDDKYILEPEARIIFQTRKVVREFLKLRDMKAAKKRAENVLKKSQKAIEKAQEKEKVEEPKEEELEIEVPKKKASKKASKNK